LSGETGSPHGDRGSRRSALARGCRPCLVCGPGHRPRGSRRHAEVATLALRAGRRAPERPRRHRLVAPPDQGRVPSGRPGGQPRRPPRRPRGRVGGSSCACDRHSETRDVSWSLSHRPALVGGGHHRRYSRYAEPRARGFTACRMRSPADLTSACSAGDRHHPRPRRLAALAPPRHLGGSPRVVGDRVPRHLRARGGGAGDG
jgi:hypothetical protein